MARHGAAHRHTWRLRAMPGYRQWDVPAGQSAMPGLLLRCDCRAFVLAQEALWEIGVHASPASSTSHYRPFDADDLEQVVAFVSTWRSGVAAVPVSRRLRSAGRWAPRGPRPGRKVGRGPERSRYGIRRPPERRSARHSGRVRPDAQGGTKVRFHGGMSGSNLGSSHVGSVCRTAHRSGLCTERPLRWADCFSAN